MRSAIVFAVLIALAVYFERVRPDNSGELSALCLFLSIGPMIGIAVEAVESKKKK